MSGFRRIQSEHIKLTGGEGIIQDKEQDYVTLNFKFHKDQLSLEAITQKSLEWAMMRSGRNKSQAASLLKTSRKLFYNPNLFSE